MENASSSTLGAQNRQKRVLPSRSRRGGPNVGTCEVDVLILETLKRRSENEPLIPANTPFILTTNSKYASDEPGGNAITVNMVANDRYFDRPEVVKAFREQAIIQTPEFSSIGESSNVGGRFRPRAAEDDGAETSDATYEKRHRKFETFEKRQRLREKEKLKHEHYKMKERLDQLRAMDGAAFMTLPASSFSPMPKEAAVDLEDISAVTSLYTNLNGHIPHAEGERRRKEMLEVATMLEERYRVLLPPDRVRKAQEPVLSESASTQVLSRASSKQPSVIRILRTAVPTPYSPPPTLPHAEASPLSPSPTIDMDIPPSPSPSTSICEPETASVLQSQERSSQERSILDQRSPTPLVRDRSVPEQEPPSEERSATPERLPTPPTREWTTSIPERLPTPPVPKRPTTPVDVADQDGLLEQRQSSLEPPAVEVGELEKAEMEDEMSVRAESEAPKEPEREEVDVESEDNKMDAEQDGHIGPIPTVAAIEQVAVADSTINTIPEETLIERTILLDVPQVPTESDSTVIVQAADVPVSEEGFNLDRAVTPEQRPHTELVDIEALMPISSISAPRSRSRKRSRLDPSVQNETVSAPVRGPRVPKNHVTFRGASGEMEVTASAILKAAVHRTQRDVTRHLNAFGVPVPNYIVQMGPPFELPEWVFPPLSPAESEHAQGDFDVDIEDFELNPTTPSNRQLTPPPTEPSEADHRLSSEVDRVEQVEQAFVQSTKQSQSGPKIVIPWLPPPRAPEPEIEEDTVSLGDEDT